MLEKGDINLKHIGTERQKIDLLTNAVDEETIVKLRLLILNKVAWYRVHEIILFLLWIFSFGT